MAEIIRDYREDAPASRFIGIRYGEDRRIGRSYAHLWHNWFEHRRFSALEALLEDHWAQAFPEAGSYIGLMRTHYGQAFEYWIGMFLPPGTRVPPGYDSLDAPAMRLGVCWVKGQEPDIYGQVDACLHRLKETGDAPAPDSEGFVWVMERYQCPRFTQPDEQGNKTLDLTVMVGILSGTADGSETMEALPEAPDLSGKSYCATCRQAFEGTRCPDCGKAGSALQADDPIYLGDLPGRYRNALQIAFGAGEIPFNALSNLGSGFTLAAGELFETYRIYVPYERLDEARAAFDSVFTINEP